MAKQFAHLHLHTQYSLLDGANKIPDILERASKLGQPAIAITDHGNLYGALEFFLAGRKAGIKPVIGCELYLTTGSRHERVSRQQGGSGTYHLTVLARDNRGYENLCKLSTLAFKEGFYFKPRVDRELLERYSEGLIVLSGCMASEVSRCAQNDDDRRAAETIEFYARVFKDRYYLEVQPHRVPEQRRLNKLAAELARSVGVPMVATNDCHYPNVDDHHAQEVLMCISTGKQITDPDRMRHDGFQLHLKTAEEMLNGFDGAEYAEEAIANSLRIAEECNVTFDTSKHFMPVYTSKGEDRPLIDIMSENARVGLEKRLETIRFHSSHWTVADEKKYRQRLEEEISLIEKMGFAGYFLIVADFIVWAKENGVPVGPGRGSAAGSLVAYALRITEIDPIANKLLFERFLNPERVSLPDIDVDFCILGRDKVLKYVIDKYGENNVAQIATFGTLKAKAAIKDVARVLGISYAEADRIAQLVPAPRQGFDYPLAEAIKMEPRLAEYARGEGKELIELALKLEGLTRHSSTHAAGVVIGDRPLVEFLPLMVDKDGNDVTQFSMGYVEKIGLVKFDFLGLKTLTVIHEALRLIKESQGKDIDLERLPLDDKKSYELLCSGNTTGVFQLESSGITDMTRRLRPNCFDDLVAILALYRPGPLDAGMVDHYINRKHGREPVVFLHPLEKDILADTYGIMLYQEQIMQLARALAGYSLGEADLLRKAMGKKIQEEMAKQRERFLKGALERKMDKKLANEIFDQMETFGRYGFNRSHSAAYAMVSFQTAYLKAHYPVEFMAALMTHEMEDSDKTLKNLNECRKNGVSVLPPDVNISTHKFSVSGKQIRYGLAAVKGIGEKAVSLMVEEREAGGPFDSLPDFLHRVDIRGINRRVIENLIKCGAFDFSRHTRKDMMDHLDEYLRTAQSLQREKETNQISLFDMGAAVTTRRKPPSANGNGKPASEIEWPVNQKLAYEKEALGFYISGHPLEKFRAELKRLGVLSTEDVLSLQAQTSVRIAGVVTALRLKNTRKGDRYASFQLEDWLGTVESLVWPDVYKQVSHILVADEPVVVSGKLDVSDERRVLIIEKMDSLLSVRDRSARLGLIMLKGDDNFEDHLDELLRVFGRYSGSCPLKVRIEVEDAEVSMVLKDTRDAPIRVMPSEQLCNEVEQIFGRPVLSFV